WPDRFELKHHETLAGTWRQFHNASVARWTCALWHRPFEPPPHRLPARALPPEPLAPQPIRHSFAAPSFHEVQHRAPRPRSPTHALPGLAIEFDGDPSPLTLLHDLFVLHFYALPGEFAELPLEAALA